MSDHLKANTGSTIQSFLKEDLLKDELMSILTNP